MNDIRRLSPYQIDKRKHYKLIRFMRKLGLIPAGKNTFNKYTYMNTSHYKEWHRKI